jgi:hypothetical protein
MTREISAATTMAMNAGIKDLRPLMIVSSGLLASPDSPAPSARATIVVKYQPALMPPPDAA